ncbi:Sodium/calcium exchanger protein [Ceratobasidium sp. AG-Ba]|nr:Sodium/calcium exchanger protein [Ceratobasidium sp. AG-Ba]QRW10821.1 Sodium/calcium exchanger protein [Ceratobasidium sp. AG-Ba]
MSAQYTPVHDLDAEDGRSPGFPQPETYNPAQSTDELPRASTSSPPAQYARVAPEPGTGRAHIRPAYHHQRTGSTGQYADPWSPGYKRNVHRFSSSVGGVQELHTPAEHAKRFSTASSTHRMSMGGTPPQGPPITKWQNFKQKFQGHRLRARGHKVPGWWQSIKAIVTCSWLNILFVFLPVAWVWGWKVAQPFVKEKKKNAYENYVYLFILSFVAIIPLENIAEFAGEQLALYCGESIGDLIIITLHNVVEVVLAWFLLLKCELKLLQATIIGVVLLHSLLVPGTAFLTGGSKIWAQSLKPRVTELNQSLLTIGVLALVVPAAFFSALPYQNPQEYAPQFANATLAADLAAAAANKTASALVRRAGVDGKEHKALEHAMEVAAQVVGMSDKTRGVLLQLSRGISVILLVIYVGSRIYLHNPPGGKKPTRTVTQFEEGETVPMHDVGSAMTPAYFDQKHRTTPPLTYASTTNLIMKEEDRERTTSMLEHEQGDGESHGHGAHEHKPEIGPWPALILLLLSVMAITITAECLVVGIKPIREQSDEKKLFTDEWFGLVLLPLLSFAGDGLNATMFFIRSHLFSQNVNPPEDFAKAKSIDLAIQFTLFWIPALVLASWAANTPLSLLFDHFEIVIVVGASFLVNSVTQDGRTNWAEGLIMVGFYTIIAVAAWFYPGDAEAHFMAYCGSLQSLFANPAANAAV